MTFEPDKATPITLTRAEALVLLDWLHRLEDDDATPGDSSQRTALWDLSATLEKTLVEPFHSSYPDVLEVAKAHLTWPDDTDQ